MNIPITKGVNMTKSDLIQALKKEAIIQYNKHADVIENTDGGACMLDDGGIEEWLFKQRLRYQQFIEYDLTSEVFSADECLLHDEIMNHIQSKCRKLS